LSGTVSGGGAPLAGALLTVVDGPNATRTARTSSTGAYDFAGFEQSGFTLRTSLSGYDDAVQGVTLTSDTVLNITLSPTPVAVLRAVREPLTVTLRPDNTYLLAGHLENSGNACAANIGGALRLDENGVTIRTLPLSVSGRIRPGETGAFTACCFVVPVGSTGAITYVVFPTFDSQRCD